MDCMDQDQSEENVYVRSWIKTDHSLLTRCVMETQPKWMKHPLSDRKIKKPAGPRLFSSNKQKLERFSTLENSSYNEIHKVVIWENWV